jgi:hypothetical protein
MTGGNRLVVETVPPVAPLSLLLDSRRSADLPLEETYMTAYEAVPERWKRVIEGRG